MRGLKDGAPGLFVNARVDTHWLAVGQDSTIDRALQYVDAGADGIFVPGLRDERGIAAVVHAVPVPVNLLAQLDIHTLAGLGVRRVSTGSLLFRAAIEATIAAACAVRDGEPVADPPGYQEVQDLIGKHQPPRSQTSG